MELYITNFRSINKANYRIDNGITLIKGFSGKGKTTILEAIKWCIFGNIKNVYPFSEKKPTNNYTEVKVIFKNIEIIRTKPPEMLKVIFDDTELIKTEAEKYIEDNIGKKNLWQACCYISQGERNILMNLTNSEKMDLIKEIVFSHEEEKINYYNKNIHNYLAQLEENIKKQEGKISYGENIIQELNKDNIEEKYLNQKKKTNEYESLNFLIEKKKKIYQEKLDNEKNIHNNKLLEQKQNVYLHAKEILVKYPFALTFNIIEKWKNYITAFKYLSDNKEIEKIEEDIEELIRIKNIILSNQKIPKLDKKQLIEEIENIKSFNKYIEEKQKLEILNTEKIRLEKEIKKIKEYLVKKYNHDNIEKFKNLVENSIERRLICPRCEEQLVLEEGILVKTNGIQLNKKDKLTISENIKKYEKLNSLTNDIISDIGKINIIKIKKPLSLDLEKKEEDLALLESFIPVEYSLEEIDKKIKKYKNYERYREQEKIMKNNYMEQFSNIKYPDNISQYYNQYLISEKNIKDYQEYVSKKGDKFKEVKSINYYNEKVEIIEEKISQIGEFKYIKNKYSDWFKINQEQKKLNDEYITYNKEKESCNKIKNLITQATNETLENLLIQLNNDISEIISEFFENAQLKISMFKKVKNQYKPYFSFSITIDNNVYDNINNLSGGEKDRFSIALTLALNKHFNFPFIMLDECMSSLDQHNRKKCLEIIKKHAHDKIIINICHETIEGYYDNIIMV